MQYFILFLTALFVSTVLVALLVKYAVPLRFVDIPDDRKIHQGAIPRVGGIGMVLGSAIALLPWLELAHSSKVYLLGVAVLSGFGILDDRYNLDYRVKLLGQLLAVSIVVFGGPLAIRSLSIGGMDALSDILAYPLTLLFLLGTTNAMNMSDGLDGLAAGLGILSLACIAYLASLADGEGVIAVCVAIIGATFGFLRYNTHPALVFMGDTGSQFLGFSVGILAVSLTQQTNTALSGVLPLLILGLPVVDTLRVIGERLSHRASPFKPDRRHFHHKLLAMGLDHYEAVLTIYVIQASFIALVFLLRYESDLLILSIYGVFFAILCGFFPLAQAFDWRRRTLAVGEKSLLAKSFAVFAGQIWLAKMAYVALSLAVPVFLLSGALLNPSAKPDLGLFAGLVLAVWMASLFSRLATLMTRFALYSCVSLVVYGIGVNGLAHPDVEAGFRYAVFALAALVAMGFVFSSKLFSITPSDYLVMFILVASANLPVFGAINYAKLAAEAAVVLYAMEYVLRRQGLAGKVLQGGCLLVLLVVALQGLNYFPIQ